MTEYFIPTGDGTAEVVEKRSRFLGRVWRVTSEEEARRLIEETKKKYYDARHNCWCYRLRAGAERYSDDGEPQGTAGQPMLGVFQKEEVTDVLCVVTRYFGGVLLGAGGLVRAYTQCAKETLDAAGVSVVRKWSQMSLTIPYPLFEKVKQEVGRCQGALGEVEYGSEITLEALLPEGMEEAFAEKVVELTAGGARPAVVGEVYKDVPRL